MKEYKNYIIRINNPKELKEGVYFVKYQIGNIRAFDLTLSNIDSKEKAQEQAFLDAKKYIDENL